MRNNVKKLSKGSSMSKIVSLNKLGRILRPRTASVISGSFDPFNDYYKEVLHWASRQSRPLVVIVHTDRVVSIRRGFSMPTENQSKRAKNVAKLNFVDWVVISSKGAHDEKILKSIKPKFLLFQTDNKDFLRGLFNMISKKYSKMKIRISDIKKEITMPVTSASFYLKKTSNPVLSKVIELAKSSNSLVGKISAVLVLGSKIIASASNSIKGEHAEKMILDNFKIKNPSSFLLYTLIPPCPMCAESIIASKISKVFYLFNYGDKMGVEKLKEVGIFVKKVNF